MLYPDYETVEQAITLINTLPILNHEKSAVFICAFLDSSEQLNTNAAEEFRNSMGFSMDDPQYVYFWLQFMQAYFKQVTEEERIMYLQKFEQFDGFNISMV